MVNPRLTLGTKVELGEGFPIPESHSMTSRRWVYTIFEEDDGDFKIFDDYERDLRAHAAFRGLSHQLEQCPTTGRVHLQGYVEFEKPQRLAALKRLSSTAHFEAAKGSRAQCVAYTSKTETRFPESTPTTDAVLLGSTGQGKRNDLLDTTLAIVNGELSRDDVFTTRPDLVCKYSKGINELLSFRAQRDRGGQRDVSVEVLHGDAGSGKTRYAYGRAGPDDVYILVQGNGGALWWDGYSGQSVLIIDDFYGWLPHAVLLRILDRYPLKIDIKGSSTYAAWTEVYITSNRHPSTWYNKAFPWHEDQALQRRIGRIFCCQKTLFGATWKCEKTNRTRVVSGLESDEFEVVEEDF